MFRSVLVPVDVAHRSSWRNALPEALMLANRRQSRLTALAVVPDLWSMLPGIELSLQLEDIVRTVRNQLSKVVAEFASGEQPIACDVKVGAIGREILTAADDLDIDLIVMESHRPEMKDYLIGPNAAHVARHAKCSVLVLRTTLDRREHGE